MHISILDIYHARENLIHKLDPRVKILASFIIILTTVILPEGAWVSQGVLFGLLILLSISARLGPFFTIRRAFIALPFLLAALPIPFQWVDPFYDHPGANMGCSSGRYFIKCHDRGQ